jgi:hypothetical protein
MRTRETAALQRYLVFFQKLEHDVSLVDISATLHHYRDILEAREVAAHVSLGEKPGDSPSYLFNRSPVMGNPTPVLAPRGHNVISAAKYWGVSPGTFRKRIRIAPASLRTDGVNRNVYDREAIDQAMTALAVAK